MSQAGGGQNAGDQTSSFFWYVVLLTAAFILIWYFGKEYLVPPIFYVRSAEIYLLDLIFKGWNGVAGLIHLPEIKTASLEKILYYMQTSDPRKVTLNQIENISMFVGNYYRYPIMAVFIGLAYVSYFRHRSARFINDYSMKTLRKEEVVSWPEITPVVSLDLVKQNLNEGPWSMAKLPLDFCKEHNLLRTVQKDGGNIWSISHGLAERLFVLQMGPMWDGVERLPLHMKAVLVIFVSRIARDKDVALTLLDQIAKSSVSGRLDFTGVDEFVKRYGNHKVVKWSATRHAYVYTVLATLLEIARVEGVLATSEFIWLKPLDRRLWYVLNSVGRWTPVVEVAGVYAHWIAEKKLRRALNTPVVSEAVIALDKAVSEILYTVEGESWHTSNVA